MPLAIAPLEHDHRHFPANRSLAWSSVILREAAGLRCGLLIRITIP
jgi:hypothetical protein